MDNDKKPRADSKLKNLPDHIQEGFWLLLHPTDVSVKPYTLEDLGGEIYDRHQISVAVSTVSEWQSWYALKRRLESAAERASQARLALAKDPGMSPEMLARVGQMVFTAETIEDGNVKAYVELVKLQLQARALEINARKLVMLEAKAAKADEAAGVANDGKLTEEEKAAKLKQIFRMG